MRHGDPHDRGALAPLCVSKHVLLVAKRVHRALDPVAKRGADVGRPFRKCDTVPTETFALSATSVIVDLFPFLISRRVFVSRLPAAY